MADSFFYNNPEGMLETISKLHNIDLGQITIDSNTKREIPSIEDETVEEAKAKAVEARNNLIRVKLRETIKDIIVGNEQSEDNNLCDEIDILSEVLEDAGFEKGKEFFYYADEDYEPEMGNYSLKEVAIRIGNVFLQFCDGWNHAEVRSMHEIEEEAKEEEKTLLNGYGNYLKLKPLELEKLGINIDNLKTPEEIGQTTEIQKDEELHYDEKVIGDEIETESPETILQKQIFAKKIQAVLDGLKDNTGITQRIDSSEYGLCYEMEEKCNDLRRFPSLFDAINREEYEKHGTENSEYFQSLYRLSNDKMLSIELFYKENYGIISLQDHDKEYLYGREDEIMVRDGRICQGLISEDIINVEELENFWSEYRTEESLRELLEKKLAMKNKQMTSLEAEERTIAETEALVDRQAGKESSDKGEK